MAAAKRRGEAGGRSSGLRNSRPEACVPNNRVPNQIRTGVRSLKSSGPRPLDDGDGKQWKNEKMEKWKDC